MVMQLEKVVPFGRSLDEYRRLFALSDQDLNKKILSVADGPASFNAEMTAQGKSVVSIDPMYIYSAQEIEAQFNTVVDNIIAQVKATPNDWVWSYHQSPEHLRAARVAVLQRFVADFETGKMAGRYRAGELPQLAFADQSFQLVLCSHFLFLYSDQLPYEFHLASVHEMLRLAPEVRIFPLLTLMLERSPHLSRLIEDLCAAGYCASIEKVDYAIQRGGDEMLRIQHPI